jgi:hypothetical protein
VRADCQDWFPHTQIEEKRISIHKLIEDIYDEAQNDLALMNAAGVSTDVEDDDGEPMIIDRPSDGSPMVHLVSDPPLQSSDAIESPAASRSSIATEMTINDDEDDEQYGVIDIVEFLPSPTSGLELHEQAARSVQLLPKDDAASDVSDAACSDTEIE